LKQKKKWRATLDTYALPVLGARRIGAGG